MRRRDKARDVAVVTFYIGFSFYALFNLLQPGHDGMQTFGWFAGWLAWAVIGVATAVCLPEKWRKATANIERERRYEDAQTEFINNIDQYRVWQRTMGQSNNR